MHIVSSHYGIDLHVDGGHTIYMDQSVKEKLLSEYNNQIPKVAKPSRKKRLKLLFYLCLLILFIGLIYYFLSEKDRLHTENYQVKISPTPHQRTYKENTLVLQRKSSDGKEKIASFSYGPEVLLGKWNNLLFLSTFNNEGNAQIVSHNTTTGKSDVLYEVGDGLTIMDIDVIDDTLFFSTGAYLREGGMYSLQLPPKGTPQKLDNLPRGSIAFEHSRYWIIGGFGDGCGGSRAHYLFNPKTKTATHVVTTFEGCLDGESYLGVDKKDRMLLSYHGGMVEFDRGIFYSSLSAVSLKTLEKTQLLTDVTMPKHTVAVGYFEEQNKVLILGDNLYALDLASDSLEELVKLPANFTKNNYSLESWSSDRVCLRALYSSDKYILISLNKRSSDATTIDTSGGSCVPTGNPNDEYERQTDKKLQEFRYSLKLPSSYELVKEVVEKEI